MLRYHFVSQVMSRDFCLSLAACSLEMKDTVCASPQDKYPPPQHAHPKMQGLGGQEKRGNLPTPTVPFLSQQSRLSGLFAQRMSREGWASPADLKGHEYSYNPLERGTLSLTKQIPPGGWGACYPFLPAACLLSAPRPLGPSWLLQIFQRPGSAAFRHESMSLFYGWIKESNSKNITDMQPDA